MIGVTRMWPVAILAAVIGYGVYLLSPQQLPVALWKLGLIALASFLGYWIDRNLFPYARPHTFSRSAMGYHQSMIRRAIIVGSAMVAFALAL